MGNNPDPIDVRELRGIKFSMDTKNPQAMTSGANQQAAPAGGVGAAAGAYDTAANRDILINLVNEIRTTLVNNGMMKGSA